MSDLILLPFLHLFSFSPVSQPTHWDPPVIWTNSWCFNSWGNFVTKAPRRLYVTATISNSEVSFVWKKCKKCVYAHIRTYLCSVCVFLPCYLFSVHEFPCVDSDCKLCSWNVKKEKKIYCRKEDYWKVKVCLSVWYVTTSKIVSNDTTIHSREEKCG